MPRLPPAAPDPHQLIQAATWLISASHPAILFGGGSHPQAHWDDRVAPAEALSARAVTDLKRAAVFPTDHPPHAGAPATFPDKQANQAIEAVEAGAVAVVDVGIVMG